MAKLVYQPNQFEDKRIEDSVSKDTLLGCLCQFGSSHSEIAKPYYGKKVLVFLNGERVPWEEWDKEISDEDVIEVTHSVEGDVIQAVVGAVMVTAGVLLLPVSGPAGWMLIGLGASMLLGTIMRVFFTPEMPTAVPGAEAKAESPTYSWEGPRTNWTSDKPIPIIYGKHLVGGQLINFNIWTSGNDNYLDMLLALGEGEINGIRNEADTSTYSTDRNFSDSQPDSYIKLNDSFESGYDGVYWAFRNGSNTQSSIPGFRTTNTVYNYDHRLTTDWSPIYTTVANNVNEITVKLECPRLYEQLDNGDINPVTIKYKIAYRVPGGSWNETEWQSISAKSKTTVRRYYTISNLSAGTYEVKVRRLNAPSDSFRISDEIYTKTITETLYKDLAYPNTALLAVRAKATNQLSGSFPNVTTLIEGRKIRVPDLGGGRQFQDYYYSPSDGTNKFRKLADDSDLCTWDGVSYTTQYCNNPAYCLRDLILNSTFGLGEYIDSSDLDDNTIDSAAFKQWQKIGWFSSAVHANEINMVVDGEAEPNSIFSSFARAGRMIIYWSGGYIKFKYDEDESPVQLFNMSNIIEDSFQTSFIAHSDIPNVIEAEFADEDDGYAMSTREVVDEDEWTSNKPRRKRTISFKGITNGEQLLREAKFALNSAKYKKKMVEFKTSIDAINCEPGDIIDIQHDVTQWGWGGRVVSGTSNTVTVNKDIDSSVVNDPTSYDIRIIHNDDTIETKDIASVSGRTITISGSWAAAPTEDEKYIIGKVTSTIKPFRVIRLDIDSGDIVSIRAAEHNSNIYSDTGLVSSTPEHEDLPNPSEQPNAITDLVLTELVNRPGFMISFNIPQEDYVFDHVDFYLSADNLTFWKIASLYDSTPFEYDNVLPGIRYYVRAYSVNKWGVRSNSYVSSNIEISGEAIGAPFSPRGLEIEGQGNKTEFIGRDCKLRWRMVDPTVGAGSTTPEKPIGQGAIHWAKVKDFKVEIWVSGQCVRKDYTPSTNYIYTWEKNAEDNSGIPSREFTVKVYQRNYYNKVSVNPAVLTVSNPPPDMSEFIPSLSGGFQTIRVGFSNYAPKDTDLDYFKVYWGTATPLTASTDRIAKSARYHVLSDLTASRKYYVKIVPYDLFGVGVESQTASTNTINIASFEITASSIAAKHLKTNIIASPYITASAILARHLKTDIVGSPYITASAILARHLKTDIVGSPYITASAIGTKHLIANAVTSPYIAASVIETTHLKSNIITSPYIAASAIEANHLKTDIITSPYIAASAIEANHLKTDIITSPYIAASVIETTHLKSNIITSPYIAASAIEANHLKTDIITSPYIAASAIETEHLKTNLIVSQYIAASAILTTHLKTNIISAEYIQSDSIKARHLSADTVAASNIKTNTITGNEIAANTITSDKLNVSTLSAISANMGTLTAGSITGGDITADTLTSGTLNVARIPDWGIHTRKLVSGTMMFSNDGGSTSSSSWETIKEVRIYIPSSIAYLRYSTNIYCVGTATGAYFRIVIGSVTGPTLSTTSLSPVWVDASSSMNVSSLSGYYTLCAQMYRSGGDTVYCREFCVFYWSS